MTDGHDTSPDAVSGWPPDRGDLAYDTRKRCLGVVVALPEDTGTTTYQLRPEGGGDGWTAPLTRLTPPAPPPEPVVLYVCAQLSEHSRGLAHECAIKEGRAFAARRGMRVVAEITDPYGEPDPAARPGWQRVRELAGRGEVAAVVVRWPNMISPDHEARYREIARCAAHGVRVLSS
jgi:hypothetical protein